MFFHSIFTWYLHVLQYLHVLPVYLHGIYMFFYTSHHYFQSYFTLYLHALSTNNLHSIYNKFPGFVVLNLHGIYMLLTGFYLTHLQSFYTMR